MSTSGSGVAEGAVNDPVASDARLPLEGAVPYPPAMGAKRLVVMGQGYVGLPLAMRAVEVGYTVIGLDVDKERVERLLAGQSFIEDVAPERLVAALATGRYTPTADIEACADFDIAVITVPTPLYEGLPDLSYIEQACEMLGPLVREGSCVVLESTTYPGTTTEVVAPILERRSGLLAGRDFRLGYSPERIDPGNETWHFENTPKIVAGIDEASRVAMTEFYSSVVDAVMEVSGTAEAELAKLVENTFRHVNIALANELAMVADELGIDIWESIRAASTKPFGFMPFYPGPGVGGHCIPVDPSFLSWRVRRRLGYAFRFVEIANDVNEHMPDYVVRRLGLAFNEQSKSLKGSRLLVLGLAYKRNSADARQSPAVPLIERLLELGAEVRLADPHVGPAPLDDRVTRVEATTEEASLADGVLLLTDHDAFDLPAIAAAAPYLFDTRHRVSGPTVEHL
jgi:UDP-N-acetyl-D-glucosamine dehydrogenase